MAKELRVYGFKIDHTEVIFEQILEKCAYQQRRGFQAKAQRQKPACSDHNQGRQEMGLDGAVGGF